MKTRKKELDVGPLTKEEEKIISDIIKSRKSKQKATPKKSTTKLTSKKKVTA